MRKVHLAIAVASALLASSANAAPVETFMTKAYPVTRDGSRVGCAIEFDAGLIDKVYNPGDVLAVSGSVALHGYVNGQPNPYVAVKLVVNKYVKGAAGAELVPYAPTTVTLLGPRNVNNRASLVNSFPSETPGGLISAYNFDDSFNSFMERTLEENKLWLTFNRKPGSLDTRLPIDLSIGTPDAKQPTVLAFADCTIELMDEVLPLLEE